MKSLNPPSIAPALLALAMLAGCGDGRDEAQAASPASAGGPDTAEAVPPAHAGRAPARPAMGTMVTNIDGQASEWEILAGVPGDDLRRPSATVASHGPLMRLSLQGTAAEDRSRQASLSANLMEQGDSFTANQAELHVHPEGARGPSLEARDLEIHWDRMELDATGGHVSGRFEGVLCPREAATAADAGCVPLEGSFDSEVGTDAVIQGILDGGSGGRP